VRIQNRDQTNTRRDVLALLGFVMLVVGGGTLIGLFNRPDGWYVGLHKPSFTPPNWLFAPVWSALFLMIAAAGWRAWQAPSPARRNLLALWVVQLVLNFLWSPLFFGAQRIGLALTDICALLLAIVAFIALARHHGERTAALLMVPYAAWVAFAALLNAALFRLNP
jgi:tryptophan-rich sensory protein